MHVNMNLLICGHGSMMIATSLLSLSLSLSFAFHSQPLLPFSFMTLTTTSGYIGLVVNLVVCVFILCTVIVYCNALFLFYCYL